MASFLDMERNAQLVSLRPVIHAEEGLQTAVERFQNEVLRPILKFQNTLLLAIFSRYCQKQKTIFRNLSEQKQLAFIENSLKKDNQIRRYCQGIVVAFFTEAEYARYVEEEEAINKRIITLLIERLASQRKSLA